MEDKEKKDINLQMEKSYKEKIEYSEDIDNFK